MSGSKTYRYPRARSLNLVVGMFLGLVFSVSVMADGHGLSEMGDSQEPSIRAELHTLARNGSAEAQYELGLRYEYGRGVGQSDSVAVHWYEKSASQLHVGSLYRLAILYDNGWGLQPDKDKALALYKTAAEKGHPLAQHDLAKMYFHGSDAPQNRLQAYKWLKIAVMGGSPLMQKHLGLVAAQMSRDEIESAEYLAAEWIENFGN